MKQYGGARAVECGALACIPGLLSAMTYFGILRLKRSRESHRYQSLAARLPPEITILILNELEPWTTGHCATENRQALARALRVCRSWYCFVDLLYSSVYLDLAALIRFHHTVHSSHRLASSVRHLHLPPLYCLPRWYWSFPNSPFVNSNNRRHECRAQFNLAVAVVRQCRRLQTLHFPSHGPFARLKSLPAGHLKNLRSLTLQSYDVAYFSSVLPASLALQSLVELRMLNYHFLPSHMASKPFAHLPRLRVLRIWSCSLDWESLGALIASVQTTLRFVELRLTSWPTSNVPAMFRALSSVERSLTMLAIRGSCGAAPSALQAHLVRFTALRYLHYDELFCARVVCTTGVRRLALVTRMRTDMWDYVRRLAEWLRDPPPGLQELSVEVHSPRRRDVRVWRWLSFCLAARCERHGIRLHVLVVRGVPLAGQTKCFYAVNRPTPERVLYETVDRIGRKGHQIKSTLRSMFGPASTTSLVA
ncbi:hypothetical protein AURDEDRAFT_111923 [Auricularia subglabra TFB-10046 SS5]|nr:hypothetical protein AURDEDRAFT_111923 [Auricularia subglabra TFB-10046 SS5]